MSVRRFDPGALMGLIGQLERAKERAKADRQKLKALIDKAEEVLSNHAGRISQNETDIQAGKEKLIEHEQRITALENP